MDVEMEDSGRGPYLLLCVLLQVNLTCLCVALSSSPITEMGALVSSSLRVVWGNQGYFADTDILQNTNL